MFLKISTSAGNLEGPTKQSPDMVIADYPNAVAENASTLCGLGRGHDRVRYRAAQRTSQLAGRRLSAPALGTALATSVWRLRTLSRNGTDRISAGSRACNERIKDSADRPQSQPPNRDRSRSDRARPRLNGSDPRCRSNGGSPHGKPILPARPGLRGPPDRHRPASTAVTKLAACKLARRARAL